MRFLKKISLVSTILGLVGFFILDIPGYFQNTIIQEKLSNILEILRLIEDIEDDVDKISSNSYSVIQCNDLEDWSNKDMNLNIDYNYKIVSLKESRESGLLFFKNLVSRRVFILNEFELGESQSPNVVIYFTDIYDKSPFRIEIGSGDPRVVTVWYKEKEIWKEAKELDGLQRLPQPIAPGSKLVVRVETTPDNGHRTIKLHLIYQPGNNPNASREDGNFTFRFPVDQQPVELNYALGLVNPKLVSETFLFKVDGCKYQEINL